MSNSRRQLVFAGVYGCLFGGISLIAGGCGGGVFGNETSTIKLDAAREKELADQRKATEEFYAAKK